MPSSGSTNGERQGELFIFLTHANFKICDVFIEANNTGIWKSSKTSNPFVEQQQHANQEYGSLKWKLAQLSSGSRILLNGSCLSAKWSFGIN
jgi:hypothetical protein